MLTEYSGIREISGGRPRRWFYSEDEDLIVWYADDGSIFGFQLCYDKQKSERALTWLPQSGFSHERVDYGGSDSAGRGLGSRLDKLTPLLVADGVFDIASLSRRFLQISQALPRDVFEFVSGKLQACTGHARDT
jgi:hypothetical protein